MIFVRFKTALRIKMGKKAFLNEFVNMVLSNYKIILRSEKTRKNDFS